MADVDDLFDDIQLAQPVEALFGLFEASEVCAVFVVDIAYVPNPVIGQADT